MKPTLDLLMGLLGLRSPRTAVNEAETELLLSFADGARSVVEVGVAEGVTSARLLERMDPGGVLFMVDPYPARLRLESVLGVSGTRGIARRSVRRYRDRAVFMSCDSLEAARSSVVAPAPSLVFLDALHEYEPVARDLAAWSRRLSNEGVIAVHDARPCPSRPELHADAGGCFAVAEALRSGWQRITEQDSLVVLRPG